MNFGIEDNWQKVGRALTLPSIARKHERNVFERGFTYEFEIILPNLLKVDFTKEQHQTRALY